MARVNVEATSANSTTRTSGQQNHPVRLSDGTLYQAVIDAGTVLVWSKSTNDGLTWSSNAVIRANCRYVASWFDKWTPGDAGTLIHFVYADATNHDVYWRSLDTATDTLGTERVVFPGASIVTGASTCLSVTKAEGGNLYCMFDIDGGAELGFYKSTDAGVNWAAADGSGAMTEAGPDYFLLFPGNEADTQDIYCIYWDRSAEEISLKVFDDSAAAMGSETSIATSMVDVASTTVAPQFAGAIRQSDDHLILVAWSNADTANADLRCWNINGAASITELTNVVLNSTDDQGGCAIAIDGDNDDIYVFYLGLSAGTETAFSAISINYKVSTDDGTTWGSETGLSTVNRAYSALWAAPNIAGGEFAVLAGTFVSNGTNALDCCALVAESGGGGMSIVGRGGLAG